MKTDMPRGTAAALRLLGLRPTFAIIGAQKSGTTFLAAWLASHPQVYVYGGDFFTDAFGWRAIGEFLRAPRLLAHPLRRALRRISGRPIAACGFNHPYALFHPLAARRIAAAAPAAKLLVLLRNPVDRAISHYHHEVRRRREPLPIEQAFALEGLRLEVATAGMRSNPQAAQPAHRRFSYLARGLYIDQLERYASCFERRQLLILKSEDLFTRPQETCRQILGFLDLPSWAPPTGAVNVGGYPREAHAGLRESLRDYYLPHNRRLSAFLGWDPGW